MEALVSYFNETDSGSPQLSLSAYFTVSLKQPTNLVKLHKRVPTERAKRRRIEPVHQQINGLDFSQANLSQRAARISQDSVCSVQDGSAQLYFPGFQAGFGPKA
jgi:hypothetical protein